jgi:hypothetical protein
MAGPDMPADPIVQDARERLGALADHFRDQISATEEPQARAILETSAEVLGGLKKTFEDYAQKNEAAWR